MGRDSLTEYRLLPRAERERFQAEIVRFHLEDLNLAAERWRAARTRRRLPPSERARVGAIVRAARWDRDGFIVGIRRFIDEGRATKGDEFGPALLLSALEIDHARFLSGVSPAVRASVEAALLDASTPLTAQSEVTSSRRPSRRR
jgi:hypothetical protein